jgi:hypothetical protein
MANIRKSFNFRTGLQVDNDNFVVNANGLVGIGTSIPQNYLLNVHGDTRVTGLTTTGRLYAGIGTVGVLSATDANISGVVTVGQLKVGSSEVVDNLIGYARTTFITDNAGVGLHTTSKLGINTTTSPGTSDAEFNVHGNANITGVLTATNLSGTLPVTDLDGTLTNAQLPTDITKSTGTFTASSFVGALSGNATTASNLAGSPNITVTDVSASNVDASGIVTATTELNVGTGGTAVTALDSGRLGIGTAIPSSEIQIRKASGSLLEVISDSGQARISIGNSVGVGNSSAVIRFGNSAGVLDIINNDIGDVKTIIHAGGPGAGSTGNFKWVYGRTNSERMTLTWDGKLGINETSPTQTLHVGGGATVDGALYVQNGLTVDGTITGTISYPSVISGSNLNNTSGITTLYDLKVTQSVNFDTASTVSLGNTVAIGTTTTSESYALIVDNGFSADTINSDGTINATGTITGNVVRAAAGFLSDISGSPIQIDYQSSPDRIVFTVTGIGSTSLLLS